MKVSAKNFLKEGSKTALVSLIFSAIFVLALSLFITFRPLSSAWVHGIDQGIKALSLLLASFLCIKDKVKGALKGVFAGTIYSLASFFLFEFAAGDVSIDVSLLADVGLGASMGLLCGALSVAFGKKISY